MNPKLYFLTERDFLNLFAFENELDFVIEYL